MEVKDKKYFIALGVIAIIVFVMVSFLIVSGRYSVDAFIESVTSAMLVAIVVVMIVEGLPLIL